MLINLYPWEMRGNSEGQGDGRVYMRPRDVAHGVDHHRHDQSTGDGRTQLRYDAGVVLVQCTSAAGHKHQ